MFGQFVSFDNLVPPFLIGVAAIFFFLQSHYIDMLRSQSSSFTSGCNRGGNRYRKGLNKTQIAKMRTSLNIR